MPRLLDAAMTPASAMGQGENLAAQDKLRRTKRVSVIRTTQQAELFAPTRVQVAQPLGRGMPKPMKSSAKYAAPP